MMRRNVRWGVGAFIVALALFAFAGLALAQAPVTVEPGSLPADQGGTVTVYASGTLTFSQRSTVRLIGHGILPTTYVNPTAIQATVPAGLAPGDYPLRVLDAAGQEVGAGTLRITAPPAPTATPKPYEPPPAGRPILTIRNYWIDPPQIRPGQEFTVTLEVYNNGSRAGENTMAVFPGGTFLPVGQNGHMFWQVHINHTFTVVQRMRAPKEMGNGPQSLQVNLSANDWEGNHYEYPQTVSVEVVGAATPGAVASGKPKLVVEEVSTEPEVVAPGEPFTMTLRLANRGNRTALNVVVSAAPELVVPAHGGNVTSAGSVRINDVTTVTIPLLLKPGKEGGRQGLSISLEYSDYSGGSYSDQQTVGLNVDTSLANRPQLLIEAYRTDPQSVSPGDSFTLTLEISNVGGGSAQRLTLSLGGEGGELLGAFVPLRGSNVSFLPNVEAGETAEVQWYLMAVGSAETKMHNLPVALAYDAGTGTREKDLQRVSLMVARRPQFKVDFYRPVEGTAMMGQPMPLPIEVVNAGTARFNVPTLEVQGEGFEFTGESSTFVGNLEPGGSWTLDAMAIPLSAGPQELVVNVHYVDDVNQTQIYSDVLTVDVMEMPVDMGPNGPAGPEGEAPPESFGAKVLRFFKGFLGLGS